MNKIFKVAIATIFLSNAFIGSAHALAIPKGSNLDTRIQTVTYSPNNVFKITAKVGRAVLIQLESDERLVGDSSTLGMGDSQGWNLAVKGNNIIFKPMVERSDTNLIVTTNKRTYVFQLSINNETTNPTYVLRFYYPDTAEKERQAMYEKNQKAYSVMSGQNTQINVNVQNQNYWGYGDKALAPTQIFDDGRFTYLVFNNGRDLPVVYKKMPDGTESLVNKHMQGNTLVIHELSKSFVLRLGKSVLGIDNRGFNADGNYNGTGTSVSNSVRILKGETK